MMRVSVALCTYNGEKYIREQLISIHNQTKLVNEIIVCDDCSDDRTIEIVKEVARKNDMPVRIFVNSVNHGCRRNFEKAIQRCTGDLIFLSDQDDIWLPSKVKTIVSYFEQHPEKNFVFTDAILINQYGADCYNKTLFQVVGMDTRTQSLFDKGYTWEVLSIDCRVTGATCAFRASLLPYCLPLPYQLIHDEAIALASASQGKIGYINQCLIKYRQHDKQAIGLSIPMSCPTRHWETTQNIMMKYLALIDQFDQRTQKKLAFIYKRFWMIRLPWAFPRLCAAFLKGEYKSNYDKPRNVFLWDIKTRFVYLFHRI